ncbi:MAG: 4-hydroxy-3-methylbut-2-enyl diphosphate reductase [bacterium]
MDVKLAKTAGFCPGVKRAIDRVLELARSEKGPIYTLGPLIHNAQVIQMLEEKNIRAVKSPEEIKEKDAILVIRAHGIPPDLEQKIRSAAFEVMDATCPLVKHVHNIIKKYAELGYHTVIVGDAGHAEIAGLMGCAEGRGYVAAGPDEAQRLPRFEKVNVVAQTTQEEKIFLDTAEVIKNRAGECVISDTICAPTRERQSETEKLARAVDMMIVVGGRNSANTVRLAQMCSSLGTATIHVETEDELDKKKIASSGSIGVTAGASTPGWMIQRVAKKIKDLRGGQAKSGLNPFVSAWELTVNTSLYTAAAAVCLTYVCMKLQGAAADPRLLTLSGLFVFSLHTINRLAERGVGTANRGKILLFSSHRHAMACVGIAAGLFAIAISASLGSRVMTVATGFWLLGVLYPFRLLLGLKKLMAFPGSKDIATALGWGIVCAYIPGLSQGMVFARAGYLALLFAILLVFMRSVMLGISAVKGDMIVGSENFYKALGPKTAHLTLFSILVCLTAILFALLGMEWKIRLVRSLLAGLSYPAVCFSLYYAGRIPAGIWAETLVDGQFILMGVLIFSGIRW